MKRAVIALILLIPLALAYEYAAYIAEVTTHEALEIITGPDRITFKNKLPEYQTVTIYLRIKNVTGLVYEDILTYHLPPKTGDTLIFSDLPLSPGEYQADIRFVTDKGVDIAKKLIIRIAGIPPLEKLKMDYKIGRIGFLDAYKRLRSMGYGFLEAIIMLLKWSI